MAGLIPQSFIDDLIARSNIVDIINTRVPLKKAGTNYLARCPFHNEKSPSFNVSEPKQFYHCFGCGASGSVISFLMQYDHLDFVEAIEELAGFYSLDVPREQRSYSGGAATPAPIPKLTSQDKHDHFQLMDLIARFFQQQLREPTGQVAIDYLKKRGFSGAISKQYRLGYVDNQWNLLKEKFATNKEKQKQLVDLGMLIEDKEQNRCYDRFRGRLMIPILNRQGHVIGFGGRTLGDDTPKYLNSPETVLFHKGKELYGLYELLQYDKKPKEILVVEGYLDVIALAQHDVHYAVASLGTATGKEQLQLLFRQTKKVICCYDGDNAGREAAWKALTQAISLLDDSTQLEFMFLPDKEDPDTYIRTFGKEAFLKLQSQALTLSDFLFSYLIGKTGSKNREAIASITPEAVNLIKQVPEYTSLFGHLRNTLGDHLQIKDEQQLKRIMTTTSETIKKPKAVKRTPMRESAILLVQNPEFAVYVPYEQLVAIDSETNIAGLNFFLNLTKHCKEHIAINPHYHTAQLIEFYREDDAQFELLTRLAEISLHDTEEETSQHLFLDALDKTIEQCTQEFISQLQAKAALQPLTIEEKKTLQQLVMLGVLPNE